MALPLNYFSTTAPAALSAGMGTGDTAVSLVDGSTFPDPAAGSNGDYTVIVGYGSTREEVCTVTAKPSANVLTVTRAQDSTAATAKNTGDVVVHGVSAREFVDLQGKVDKTGGTMTGALILDDDPTAALGAATKQYVDGSMPLGAIISYGGTSAPTGWALCDGTAHGSTALATLIGSANAPNLRDRFVVGAGSTYADKATGGAATVTLSAAQSGLPAHNHTNTVGTESATHKHAYDAVSYGSYGALSVGLGGDAGNKVGYLSAHGGTETASHNHTVTINYTVAASATSSHENRPPYYALTYIIKTI